MAFLRSTFATSVLLLAFLVIASADYYGYDPAPKVQKPEATTEYYNNYYSSTPKVEKVETKVDYNPHLTKPYYAEESKPKANYYDNGYDPTPKVEKVAGKVDYNQHLTKPYYGGESETKTYYYNNGYVPTPKVEKAEDKVDYNPHLTKPDYGEESKPQTNYYDNEYVPAPKVKKVEAKVDYNPQLTKPNYGEESKPKTVYYNNGYSSAPTVQKLQDESSYKPHPTKPDHGEESKSETDNYDNGYGPSPKVENPKPKTDYPVEKPDPIKRDFYEVPKPKGKVKQHLLPTTIGVQGVVLCKSGSTYSPIQGAVTRITCGSEDEHGYDTGSISVLSHVTDNKGYFYATVSLEELGSKLKVSECKAYLESSPLETCKVPTDVNYGISGARLSSYRILENKVKLYTVGPFFCTSQPTKPLPNGY
ncbi:proline-rich protein 3-like [Vigna umbellata]|uniref:proline-rich protein 3-like n=1 Tax=Vigna umbellata TaxID=87088 RepID=UPI001F5ECB7B|nr:proline-rich protein 3-like [Vigna umbellata]